MRAWFCKATLLACAMNGGAFAQGEQPAIPPIPTAPPAASVALWNGRDLSGWVVFLKDNERPPRGFYKVKDGVLGFAPKLNGYVRTDKPFSNYHLHVEYRWPEKVANSGIFLHVREPDAIWPHAVQANLRIDATGDLIPHAPLTFNGGKETVKHAGSFNEKAAGEWNGCDIVCRADSIQVLINGEEKNSADKMSASSGFVAFQLEGAPIEFRNLWLEELPKRK